MSQGFLSDSDLKEVLASALHVTPPSQPAAWWDPIVRRSNKAAYREIVRRLAKRGFTQQQIDAWEDGDDFQGKLGLWWCFTLGGLPEDYSDKYLKQLDCRADI